MSNEFKVGWSGHPPSAVLSTTFSITNYVAVGN
jgi:hypothetical protein